MSGLDLARIAANATSVAMRVAGTAKTTGTLHLGKTETYNYSTDQTVEGGGQDIEVEGILWDAIQDQGPDVTARSARFLIEGAKVPTEIDEADSITIDGAVWQIKDSARVPTGAVKILKLRR
jgi:hypothetical protein